MSWPCIVGLKRINGEAIGCYVHQDGAPGEAGVVLLNCYNSAQKAEELVKEGEKDELYYRVAPQEILDQIRDEIKGKKQQFHYGESGNQLTDYGYYNYRLYFEGCNIPSVNDDFEISRKYYSGLDNILKLEYESIYIFDETEEAWMVGINDDDAAWHVVDSMVSNFAKLDEWLENRDGKSPYKNGIESRHCKTATKAKEKCMEFERKANLASLSMFEFYDPNSHGYRRISPSELVRYINEELDVATANDKYHNYHKYMYKENAFVIMQYRESINGWVELVSDDDPRELVNITSAQDFLGSCRLFRAPLLAQLYCEQNNIE